MTLPDKLADIRRGLVKPLIWLVRIKLDDLPLRLREATNG